MTVAAPVIIVGKYTGSTVFTFSIFVSSSSPLFNFAVSNARTALGVVLADVIAVATTPATATKDKIVAELRLINNRAFIVFSFRVKFKSEKKQCKI